LTGVKDRTVREPFGPVAVSQPMVQWRRQHRIEIFLPLRRGDGQPVDKAELDEIEHRLADRHGGVTAYLQSPAEGLWDDGGDRQRDRIVVMEVMVDDLDATLWSDLQHELEQRFQQDEVVIRAQAIERLAR
jgi:hypothetical protein